MVSAELKAPFPAFGGKRPVAGLVWSRFGDVRNYIEPFCFSAAMLLCRPADHKAAVETVNDLNVYVANFWRAVQQDPEAVAVAADWPVNEADLHARHRWLVTSAEAQAALLRVKEDPDFCDARIAGWWAWGACCWIGSGWCNTAETAEWKQTPHIAYPGQGVHRQALTQKRCKLTGNGQTGVHRMHQKRPQLADGNGGPGQKGVNGLSQQLPMLTGGYGYAGRSVHTDHHIVRGRVQLADAFSRGRGVNGNDHAGTCIERRIWLTGWILALADRLRPVRVCCGHWKRVCDSPSTTTRLGVTGAFLDPPYRKKVDGKANRAAHLYANDSSQDVDALCDEVQAWALERGADPEMRIAVCGLEGEYPGLDAAGWDCVAWKAVGGYGNQSGKVNDNARRERIWFSPACITPAAARTLFDG